jgi:D-3-phosphoglycerate dehydrogenase / 2-oxoglutarate reductase
LKFKVLVSAPYFQPVIEQFNSVFEEHEISLIVPQVNERLSEEELLAIIEDIDGVIGGDDRFTAKVFECARRLKVISKWGTGIDSIDQEAATRSGVSVRNTPGAFTDPVADTVMAYILSFARKIPWMDRDIKEGQWSKIKGVSLQECTLGVIGVGDIGKAVVRRATAFGMRIIGCDIVRIDAEFIDDTGLEMMNKQQLLAEADFISLNCVLNESSFHIMDEHAFKAAKKTAYLVNTARGPLVDESALAQALQGCQIAGAALDVFEDEPLPIDSPLRRMDNCLLAPHNSNSSPEAWQRVHENTLRNLLEGLGCV